MSDVVNLDEKESMRLKIMRFPKNVALGVFPVPSRPADLLVVVSGASGRAIVDDVANICLIDSHPVGDRRDHAALAPTSEQFLVLSARFLVHSAVVFGYVSPAKEFRQLSFDASRRFPGVDVDDRRPVELELNGIRPIIVIHAFDKGQIDNVLKGSKISVRSNDFFATAKQGSVRNRYIFFRTRCGPHRIATG